MKLRVGKKVLVVVTVSDVMIVTGQFGLISTRQAKGPTPHMGAALCH